MSGVRPPTCLAWACPEPTAVGYGATTGPRVLRVLRGDEGVDSRLVGLGVVFGVAAGLLGVGYRRLR
jgi:hypothetical protein